MLFRSPDAYLARRTSVAGSTSHTAQVSSQTVPRRMELMPEWQKLKEGEAEAADVGLQPPGTVIGVRFAGFAGKVVLRILLWADFTAQYSALAKTLTAEVPVVVTDGKAAAPLQYEQALVLGTQNAGPFKDLFSSAPGISKEHVRLKLTRIGLTVTDLSTNGTELRRLSAGSPAPTLKLARSEVRLAKSPTAKADFQNALSGLYQFLNENNDVARHILAALGLSPVKGTVFDPSLLANNGRFVLALAFREYAENAPVAVPIVGPAPDDAEAQKDYLATVQVLADVNAFLESNGKTPFLVVGSVDKALSVLKQYGVSEFQAVVGMGTTADQIRRLIPESQTLSARRFVNLLALDSRLASFAAALKTYYATVRAA